jgi:glycosyltransferase involved in cell wall biosynthesis
VPVTPPAAPLRAVFVSYDGALDPLGATQVVPYLVGLSRRGVALSLVSFEKPERAGDTAARRALQERLLAASIDWRPLRYHRRPRVPATLWDVARGARAVDREVRRTGARLVHARGDVAAAMARRAGLGAGVRLLYDVRGLFSDERVESASWAKGGVVDRLVRKEEAANLRAASGIVVLTEPAREALAARRTPLPPLRVIPTCADLSLFTPRASGEAAEYGLVYSGSLGTWYMADEMVAFARVAAPIVGGRTLFLTPDTDAARRAGVSDDWADLRHASPAEVPAWLRRAQASFFMIRPTPAKRASSPTKLAESLASGLPIVANRGVGDLDQVVEREGVGVLVDGFTPEAYRRAAERLRDLRRDPGTAARCRRLAETRYSLDAGVTAYHELYRVLVDERG